MHTFFHFGFSDLSITLEPQEACGACGKDEIFLPECGISSPENDMQLHVETTSQHMELCAK